MKSLDSIKLMKPLHDLGISEITPVYGQNGSQTPVGVRVGDLNEYSSHILFCSEVASGNTIDTIIRPDSVSETIIPENGDLDFGDPEFYNRVVNVVEKHLGFAGDHFLAFDGKLIQLEDLVYNFAKLATRVFEKMVIKVSARDSRVVIHNSHPEDGFIQLFVKVNHGSTLKMLHEKGISPEKAAAHVEANTTEEPEADATIRFARTLDGGTSELRRLRENEEISTEKLGMVANQHHDEDFDVNKWVEEQQAKPKKLAFEMAFQKAAAQVKFPSTIDMNDVLEKMTVKDIFGSQLKDMIDEMGTEVFSKEDQTMKPTAYFLPTEELGVWRRTTFNAPRRSGSSV